MTQRALCRLAVIRSMMTRPQTTAANCILRTRSVNNTSNFNQKRSWLQPCSSYSSDKGGSSAAAIFNIQDSDDFNERVLKSKIPTVVDFHAGWCNPCKMLAPRLEKVIAETEGKVQLAKVDIDANTDLAIDYDVDSVPTVLAVKGGKITDKFIGVKEVHQLEMFVEKLY